MRECHVRFCEQRRVQFPPLTLLNLYAGWFVIDGIDPYGEQEAKCKCCCIKSITTDPDTKAEARKMNQKGQYTPVGDWYGNRFKVTITFEHKEWDKEEYGACELFWGEKSSINFYFGGNKIEKDKWHDMYTKAHTSSTFSPWRKYAKSKRPPKKPITIIDTPALGLGKSRSATRDLYFAIMVKSAPECLCANTAIIVFAHQFLSVKSGTPVKDYTTGKPVSYIETAGVPDWPKEVDKQLIGE